MAKRKRIAEYRLLITPHLDERTYRPTTKFVLQTMQAFAAFPYELSIEETMVGKSISFRILGIKAPSLTLPSAGHAQFVREFEGLRGTYTVTVIGLDGSTASCAAKIGPEKVDILKKPTGASLTVTTDARQWKD